MSSDDQSELSADKETSYKFQRLREKIRKAIDVGEFKGKLPGERALARRFHVNAKTLSKALTDLAAEGVLDRSIGRGTYVKGTAPAGNSKPSKYLLICEEEQQNQCLARLLRRSRPELGIIGPGDHPRPSFLTQFTAVISLTPKGSESLIRDLLVRNMPIVALGYEPKAYSTHCVVVDVPLGAHRLTRDMLLAGHKYLAAIEPHGKDAVVRAMRQAAGRYSSEATIESASFSDVARLVQAGVTGFVCGSVLNAKQTVDAVENLHVPVPEKLSIGAVGCACPDAGCSGYFVECQRLVDAALMLLNETPPQPTTLWLPGAWTDRNTMGPKERGIPIERLAESRSAGVLV